MRYFEVEYLTIDFTKLTTEVEAKDEEEAEEIAFGKQPRPKGRGFSCVQTTLD